MTLQDTQPARWLRARESVDVVRPGSAPAWDHFTTEVCAAGLAGLILEHASRLDIPLPPTVAGRLRRAAMAVAAHNMHLSNELEDIASVLNRASLPFMLLKGAALHRTLYRRPDLRPMSDLDLLESSAAVRRAARWTSSIVGETARRPSICSIVSLFSAQACACGK